MMAALTLLTVFTASLDSGRCIQCPAAAHGIIIALALITIAVLLLYMLYVVYTRPPGFLRSTSRAMRRWVLWLLTKDLVAKGKQLLSFYQVTLLSHPSPAPSALPLPAE